MMGTKPDLEIIGLIAKEMGVNIGVWSPDKVFEEIRRTVHGYNIPLPMIATGGAAQTTPVNGRVPVTARPDLIQSARDTLFTSGSFGTIFQNAELRPGSARRFVFRKAAVSSLMNFLILSLIKAAWSPSCF